jgi:hypothetical protein
MKVLALAPKHGSMALFHRVRKTAVFLTRLFSMEINSMAAIFLPFVVRQCLIMQINV